MSPGLDFINVGKCISCAFLFFTENILLASWKDQGFICQAGWCHHPSAGTGVASSSLILRLAPVQPVLGFLSAMLKPGLPNTLQKSKPWIPSLGSYLMCRSVCSWIPKPKLPGSEKLCFLDSHSHTVRPSSRIPCACAVDSDLLISPGTEGSHSVSSF